MAGQVELIPLEELGRPRVDVSWQIRRWNHADLAHRKMIPLTWLEIDQVNWIEAVQ